MHDLFLRWFQLNSVVLLEKIYTGAPNEKLLAKYLNVISGFLESFRAYLCKLIQVDLFCENLMRSKNLGNGILSAKFPSR